MCGIVGIAGFMPVNQSIYDALTVLQHRGQDAAGIITIDANNCFRLRKANGLVNDVFEARHMQRLQGNMGIGHVRYPTAGSSSASEAQPFYVNSPYGITLAHNGNLTNAHELRKKLFEEKRRHINTTSDSEILLNVFASELDNFRRQYLCCHCCDQPPDPRCIRLRGDDYRSRYGCLPRSKRHSSAGAGQARPWRWPYRIYGCL